MSVIGRWWRRGILSLLSISLGCLVLLLFAFIYIESFLPDVATLKNVQFQVPLRVYTRDGKLMAEYGEKRRIPITLDQVPKPLINAVLATEDQRFYEHPGVDVLGLFRATIGVIQSGAKTQGASTITMQVARNFFLSRKKTYGRKINEILLALKIDQELPKEKILELYLNKIYFGNRAYGIAAAAQIYFGKTLSQLTLAEMATLAGLPKAPSKINPLVNPAASISRRNHVLARLYEQGYIDAKSYRVAIIAPNTACYHAPEIAIEAPYAAETARQTIEQYYGENAYTDGFKVYTTIDSRLQEAANDALRNALIAYDSRHGYRGPLLNVGDPDSKSRAASLDQLHHIPAINHLQPALILNLSARSATALLGNGKIIPLEWSGLAWARRLYHGRLGGIPGNAYQILARGDIVYVLETKDEWHLAQEPRVEGSLIALNPKTGAMFALVGGFNYKKSNFNRVTQAHLQPGSSFKPFIYAAALAKGYTLATLVNDAPVVREDPSLSGLWRPQNDERRFYGPTRLRMALVHSVNLVSIRLLNEIGIPYAISFVSRFGFDPKIMPHTLSLALGTLSVTPLQMAAGYSVFANGGYRIEPYIIDKIADTDNKVVWQAHPKLACDHCEASSYNNGLISTSLSSETTMVSGSDSPEGEPASKKATDLAHARIISPQIAYLMTSALHDVIENGTGRLAKSLERSDLAGKTGTTNDYKDAWFSGYSPDLVATCWVGFDEPQSLREHGAVAALPMWIDFMRVALATTPIRQWAMPADLVTVNIDPDTGLLAAANQKNALAEIFRSAYVPTATAAGGVDAVQEADAANATSTTATSTSDVTNSTPATALNQESQDNINSAVPSVGTEHEASKSLAATPTPSSSSSATPESEDAAAKEKNANLALDKEGEPEATSSSVSENKNSVPSDKNTNDNDNSDQSAESATTNTVNNDATPLPNNGSNVEDIY